MIDHLGIAVSDYNRARRFYEKALAPLGYAVVMEVGIEEGEPSAGLGPGGRPYFWIAAGKRSKSPLHIAFAAKDRPAVDAFYRAALAAGGKDNGAPGIRAHYHPNYYGAFVLDADGNNIEAVCHAPA
jgi:catechol 2,3-dioxygenase-like lactoylglutathione lyase family enzyme